MDEIHAVADDKRGAHLTLSLERLDLLANRPTRIGLSATQKPIEEIAHFLTGAGRPAPAIVNIGHRRKLDLAVEVPPSELGPIASNEMWGEIYDRIAELALQHRSTLVFVNTRRLAERVALHLGERIGEEQVAAHHGSLARKLRLAAERKLKNGEIRLLVATASLELGIDIGTVDLVCQINSPRSIAVALQRVGRAGHWRGAVPKGRLFATTRDDLVECAAAVRAIKHGDLDRIQIPDAPLDILAQQIVAMCSCEDWDEDALFDCVRRAYPYRELRREEYDRILEMLSQGIAAKRGRYGAYLYRDMVNRRLRGAARSAAGGHHQRRRDSGDRAVHRGGAAGRDRRRHARRRLRGGEQCRRHHAAGQHLVAHSPRRVQLRTRAGGRCARRAADDSLLARRSSGAHRRAVASRGRVARARQRAAAEHCAAAGAGESRTRRRWPRRSPAESRACCAASNPVPKCRTRSRG